MNRNNSKIIFSWTSTLKDIGLFLILFLIGLLISRTTGLFSLIGYLLAGFALLAIISLPLMGGTGTAPCPICGTIMEVIIKACNYLPCHNCKEYFESRKGMLCQMDLKHISEKPIFAVCLPWDDLSSATAPTISFALNAEDYLKEKIQGAVMNKKIQDRIVPASWPSGCCVCGAPSTRTIAVAQKLILGPEGVAGVRDRELTIIAMGIPHCDIHGDGVQFARTPFEQGRWGLQFRSYAYQAEFRRDNSWCK